VCATDELRIIRNRTVARREERVVEVRREIVLPAGRDEVWAALTEPERLEEWFANDVEFDPRPGGAGVFRWSNGEERRAVVEAAEPEERLELSLDDAASVAFTLEDDPDGTRLTVLETSPGPQACAAEWAWGIELWRLTLPARSLPRSPIRLAVA
jgi:uncharacterized protein YndB with AHSA1/START domain